jgi:hypothetical protein
LDNQNVFDPEKDAPDNCNELKTKAHTSDGEPPTNSDASAVDEEVADNSHHEVVTDLKRTSTASSRVLTSGA